MFDVSLPKWPAILVTGEPVTPEQARLIILRTSGLYFSTNDHDFESALYEIIGVPMDRYGPNWEALDQKIYELGILPLDYLINERIASAYVGGPYGWVDWDGTVALSNKNIGKWPSCELVLREWELIAKKFPFLKLTCHLFDKEYCEENPKPVVKYVVSGGEATMGEPDDVSFGYVEPTYSFLSDRNEQGCSLETFREMVELVKSPNIT